MKILTIVENLHLFSFFREINIQINVPFLKTILYLWGLPEGRQIIIYQII
ncbi:hypothetical protein PEPS_24740 [Persicobacter psychrovividus]|uniref:Uncharacterized protein n=1 Tax=Persicobacter psychrovividus TaxID=387638 RepID=A0ABM7VGV7_9BACT|nr:hypothetical protein PEPS_24740 [Persicobacter psychrovividus]